MTTPIFEQGGYDYDFVQPPPERLICKICQCPCRDAQMTVCCGNAFCNSCLQKAGQVRTVINACPMCREIPFNTFPSKRDDREVKELRVYCTNKVKGCEWQGELNYINIHLGAGCQFEEVKCTIECGKMIERRYLTSHVETECPRRKVNCQYCHGRGEHEFIEGRHKEECPKLPLACPNKCEVGTVPREDMEAHRKECPLEMIQCEYHNVGCEVRMARKDQVKHENERMKDHLMMTQVKLSSNEERLNNLEVLVHQLITNKCATRGPDGGLVGSIRWFLYLSSMATMTGSGDQVCPVIVKMTQFSKLKQDDVEWFSDPFYSHKKGYKMCLNVDAAGNGIGKGTHLSVFLYLMKGPHDDELRWPLREKFEVKLLNQTSDSEHFRNVINYDIAPATTASRVADGGRAEIGRGHAKFISNEHLHKNDAKCQFIKDDCVLFQISK